jgi:tRNA 2-thiouridine synthesizing protein A
VRPHHQEKETAMAATLLDAKGLNCPLPILKAKKALNGLAVGDVLEILATDPGSVKDFEAFCRQTGNELLSSTKDNNVFKFEIRRAK